MAGLEEGETAKAGLVAALHATLGPITQVMGHRWAEAHIHGHKAQTDGQMSTPKGWSAAQWGHSGLLPASSWACPPTCLGSHNLARPCLVGRVGGQLGEHHLYGLKLLVLGWDGAHLVGHLIAFHGDILPLDAGGQKGKDQHKSKPVRREHCGP